MGLRGRNGRRLGSRRRDVRRIQGRRASLADRELVNHLLNPRRLLGDPRGGGFLQFGGHGPRHNHRAFLGNNADVPRLEDGILEKLSLDFCGDGFVIGCGTGLLEIARAQTQQSAEQQDKNLRFQLARQHKHPLHG